MRLNIVWMAVLVAGLNFGTGAAAETDLSTLPDPTRPAAAGESEDVHPRGLTAIRITARQRYAVIDGQTVSVGDTAAGSVVQAIRPDKVLIRRGDQVSTLRLMPELKHKVPQGNTGK